jgi:hypothetical protein
MATLEQLATDQSGVTARYRRAMEAHDVDGVIATLAPDVVLHSPITDRAAFHGHDEMRELLRAIFATINDIGYVAEVGDARTRALFVRATINGQSSAEAIRIELNDQAQISEITAFVRPLPGLTALAAALGPRVVAGRHGRLRVSIARLLFAPLALATRLGDRLVSWFV